MEQKNVRANLMQEVEVFGVPALYTSCRIARETVYPGLHCYELEAEAGRSGSYRLVNEAADFYGTILTPVPLEGTEGAGRKFSLGDLRICPEHESCTPAEFEGKYLSPGNQP